MSSEKTSPVDGSVTSGHEPCGWLFKRGGLRKNWLKRWFVLANTRTLIFLAYFENSDVYDKNTSIPKGIVPLTGARLCSGEAAEQKSGHKHSLLIQTASREYAIYADTTEEIERWVKWLDAAMQDWSRQQDGELKSETVSPGSPDAYPSPSTHES